MTQGDTQPQKSSPENFGTLPPGDPGAVEAPNTPVLNLLADGRNENLERVIDVPLAVQLRFGQRRLSLREVLALGTGSLVELDRQVEEPVDLVLGDRLIARGEVVIVDGNYGLRVTEVIEGAANRLARQHTAATRTPAAGTGERS